MSAGGVSAAFDGLKDSARHSWEVSRGGKKLVVVQVGHCSLSVGAGEVAEALSSSLPQDAYLVISGCDGACFDAPQVVVAGPTAESQRRFSRVTPEAAPGLLSAPQSPRHDPEPFFAAQHRLAMDGCGSMACTDIDDTYSAAAIWDWRPRSRCHRRRS